MRLPLPLTKDIVLIGGGHTHALVLRMWAMAPLAGARLTLISPEPTATYSGMLPGHVAGHYARDALEIDLVRLAGQAGARLITGRATGIDRQARHVIVPGRPPVAYDLASVDIGITTEMPELDGFATHAIAAKPLAGYADAWAAWLSTLPAMPTDLPLAVIGSGIAGVELALASAHRLSALGHRPQITVIERAAEPMPGIRPATRRALLRHLATAGITLIAGAEARSVTAAEVILADGHRIPSRFTLGVAGARASGWLTQTGLALHEGHIRVRPTLQSETDPAIFAAGDCAHMADAPRPKAGVFAVRQAPILFRNLHAAASGGVLRPYQPQRDYLKLISTGGKTAIADRFAMPLSGGRVWRWKDRIDRRFMAMFAAMPPMPVPLLPMQLAEGMRDEVAGGKPICGGCGAKVGRGALKAALAALPAPSRPDVLHGAGDDAATLRHGSGWQVITTDHLRSFTLDPWQMTRIAAMHALGDVWAMGARPQGALMHLTLPPLSPALQQRTLREIAGAASEVFTAEGADLVGGHTAIGAELMVGFTVTGLSDTPPIGQTGARPGDVLILTKPIGSGTVMAAAMLGAASGKDVASALASMGRSQGAAARILAPDAHAMTDVTGFGLAGHLAGLAEASGVAATLRLAALPVLPGAEALAAAGHRSSLYPANRLQPLLGPVPPGPRAELLFDPQTAGGLLAAVAATAADGCLAALRDAGFAAAIIGTVDAGPPQISVQD